MYARDIMADGGQYVRSGQEKTRRLRVEPHSEFVIPKYEFEIKQISNLIKLVKRLAPDESYALVAQES